MTHEADDVRRQLDRLREQGYDEIIEDYSDTIEAFMERVVEDGTYTPEENVTAALNLTLRERITGDREQDVTAVFITGLILGSALERDIPMDSDVEDAWKDGEVSLPDE